MNLLEFYPTPPRLIDKMLSGIDFKQLFTVLEPTAGKGNICNEVNRKMRYATINIISSRAISFCLMLERKYEQNKN